MKKLIIIIFVINLMLVVIFQSFFSVNANFINQKNCTVLENNYKDYRNCIIKTSEEAVDGRAYLFPGYLFPRNVKRAFGVLFAGEYIAGNISFNGDKYYYNWETAYIFSFNGYIHNHYDGHWEVFDMDGIAKFVRVYYS